MANRISFDRIASFSEKNNILKKTVQQVFKNFRENFQKFGKVTDEDLISLNSIFGETLEKALEIVEENKVTYFYNNPDNIGIYQVEGSCCRTYTIFASVNYCSCPSYKYQVSEGSHLICKHVLATVIAYVTGKLHSIQVTDEHFRDLILGSDSQNFKMNDGEDWPNSSSNSQHCIYLPRDAFSVHHESQSNWAHVPPQTMPWGLPPDSHPSVVRFTAGGFSGQHTHKRKCETPSEMPSAKVLVTEEKMAAYLRSLHISDSFGENDHVIPRVNCKEKAMESEQLPKLVISDEIRNMKTDLIIPESILKSLEKPEMALVLWQPPPADLGSKLNELKKLSKTKEMEKKKSDEYEKENNEKGMEIEKDIDEKIMDIVMETETENNNVDSIFRPIDPVPMPQVQEQYFQPVPQFHGYVPFS